jgi:hypothetical protein
MKPAHTMPTPLRTTRQTTESTGELQEQIRRRAYELYEQRGRDDGQPFPRLSGRLDVNRTVLNPAFHRSKSTAA